ncbi:MAG: Ppx/GppA family phosphatase, partial [Proteobacteria bacterium]|nr:Ppx/GppA family phosphatase [Pseudomonadota bacterium]
MAAPGRLNGTGPVAIVDIGSNSVRLVVYEHLARTATPLFNEKELCGLARGLGESGELHEAAVDETLMALRRFAAIAEALKVDSLHVLATAAVREASNGAAFIAAVERIVQSPATVLSGRDEARLSALGVISGFQHPDGVAGDLGGGSLEVIGVANRSIGSGETTALGVIRLQEKAGGSTKKASRVAAEVLSRSKVLAASSRRTFYAIGGTWRSLARLHMRQKGYPLHIMHHYEMAPDEVVDFCAMLTRRAIESVDSIDAISRVRRPFLPFGAVVLRELVEVMQPDRIVMSALGMREGLLYDLLSDAEQARDPLIAACEELAYLRSRSPEHVDELVPWTGMVLEAIGLDETPEEARLRHAACLLSDIGWRA